MLRERDLGLYAAPSNETVEEYLTRWLRDYVKANLSGNTYEGYARCVKRYIIPNIGDVKLTKLRPQQITSMYARLREQPARGGGKLSGHTLLHAHRVLREALRHAVQDYHNIAVNPCDAVKPPKAEDKEMKTISAEQTAHLLRGLDGTRYYTPVLLAVTCGLRRGELLALRWQDVDLHSGKLAVRQALEQTKDGIKTKRPKTRKSERLIVMPALAVSTLKTHKSEQNAAKLEQGNTWKDNDLVFPAPDAHSGEFGHPVRMKSAS